MIGPSVAVSLSNWMSVAPAVIELSMMSAKAVSSEYPRSRRLSTKADACGVASAERTLSTEYKMEPEPEQIYNSRLHDAEARSTHDLRDFTLFVTTSAVSQPSLSDGRIPGQFRTQSEMQGTGALHCRPARTARFDSRGKRNRQERSEGGQPPEPSGSDTG